MPPGVPTGLAVNAGDGAVSLAWIAPTSDGGAAITGYTIGVVPVAQTTVTLNGTAAVVRGLTDQTSYSFSVAAVNSAGAGAMSASVPATPSAASMSRYAPLMVPGDPNSLSGIFDPAIVSTSSGTVWLAYSSVHYYTNPAGQIVQDVSTGIAQSADGGQTFTYVQTVGAAQGPVTVTDTTHSVCGQPTCIGRWIYEVPFLVEDSTDPNPARVYKVFAHKYFLYPPDAPGTEHVLGAIVMWTASTPNGTWSAETPVLSWNDTPPEIPGGQNINQLNSALAPCLLLTEGAVSAIGGALDFAFNCTYPSAGSFPVKIVLLRSSDHATTFSYVSTLLMPSDASIVTGAAYFNAPALIPVPGGAPALIVTPDNGSGTYMGCVVIPFANEQAGTLMRDSNDLPVSILTMPTLNGHFGGACAWDRSASTTGILMDDFNPAREQPFAILATHQSL